MVEPVLMIRAIAIAVGAPCFQWVMAERSVVEWGIGESGSNVETGNCVKATMPPSKIAAISSEVATGCRANGRERLTGVPR